MTQEQITDATSGAVVAPHMADELTPEMIEAGRRAAHHVGLSGPDLRAIYTAMHSSRPNPEGLTEAGDDGSLTLDNASVQRLMDYGLLHRLDDGWHVGKWPQTNLASPTAAPDEDAEWLLELASKLSGISGQQADVRARLERIASRLKANPEAKAGIQQEGGE